MSEKTDLCYKNICNVGFILSASMLLRDYHGSNTSFWTGMVHLSVSGKLWAKVVEPSITETSAKCTQKPECKRYYSFLKIKIFIMLILYYQVTLWLLCVKSLELK